MITVLVQNVIVRRVVAYTVDVVLLFVPLMLSGFLVQQLFGYQPQTGPMIWATVLINFSIPVWLYFTYADQSSKGQTFGKRWCGIRTISDNETTLTVGQALLRTAIKLIPWELTHISSFALSTDLNQFGRVQQIGLTVVGLLAFLYLGVTLMTNGQRSLYDLIVGTKVQRI